MTDVSDAGQQARLFLEAQAADRAHRARHELVDAQQLADALDLIDAAVPQVAEGRSLEEFQARVSRANARLRIRLERRR